MTVIPCPACTRPIIAAYRLGTTYQALILDAATVTDGYAIQPGGSAYPTRGAGHQPHQCDGFGDGIQVVVAQRGMAIIVAPIDNAREVVEQILHGKLTGPVEQHDAVLQALEQAGFHVHTWAKTATP